MPTGESMLTTLRNNKLNLKRDSKFGYEIDNTKTKLDFSKLPQSTPETLKIIQEKLQSENKLRKQKNLILIGFLMVVLALIYYML